MQADRDIYWARIRAALDLAMRNARPEEIEAYRRSLIEIGEPLIVPAVDLDEGGHEEEGGDA